MTTNDDPENTNTDEISDDELEDVAGAVQMESRKANPKPGKSRFSASGTGNRDEPSGILKDGADGKS